MFNFTHPKTVYRTQDPTLYALGRDAAETGDGTFQHEGRLWRVGEGMTDEQLELYPEIKHR